jgi:hypothetical protein
MSPGGPLVILYAEDLGETQRRLEDVGARIVVGDQRAIT